MSSSQYGTDGAEALGAAGMVGLACYFLFILGAVIFMVWIYWRILVKAGYSGWLSLLNLVPLGTFVIMMILAFGKWPALENRGGPPPAYSPPYTQQYQEPQQGYYGQQGPGDAYGPPPSPPAPPYSG